MVLNMSISESLEMSSKTFSAKASPSISSGTLIDYFRKRKLRPSPMQISSTPVRNRSADINDVNTPTNQRTLPSPSVTRQNVAMSNCGPSFMTSMCTLEAFSPISSENNEEKLFRTRNLHEKLREISETETLSSPAHRRISKVASDLRSPLPITLVNEENIIHDSPKNDVLVTPENLRSTNRRLYDNDNDGSIVKFLKIRKPCVRSLQRFFENRKSTASNEIDSSAKKSFSSLFPKQGAVLSNENSEDDKSERPNPVDAAIEKSLDNPDLIGDFSKVYTLPTVKGKNPDMPSISPSTVVKILNGKHEESFLILDCRYPYEYEGGHIIGAENFYIKEEMAEKLFSSYISLNPSSRPILIFHCEFSSERGPKMFRFVRSKDREMNMENYPSLHYPEMYVLEGGYRAFYAEYKEHCIPQGYKPMRDEGSTQDLVHFRAKCRSDNNSRCPRKYGSHIRGRLQF